MKHYDIIIAGAGFAGIYTAWRLARDGVSVALVEAADGIGGNLQSRQWNGYWVDNGTHNFDIRTPIGEAFYTDILGDNMQVFEDQQWATVTDTTWVPGFELPDFCDAPALAATMLDELHALEKTHDPDAPLPPDYLTWYARTYGDTLARTLAPMMRKYSGSDPAGFAVEARGSLGMFSRPRLGSDAEMIALKEKSAFFDDRVGVSLMSGDPRFSGKSVNKRFAYPARQGLMGFCTSAARRLADLGVDIYTSAGVSAIRDDAAQVIVTAGPHELTGKKLFWSLPEVVLAKVLNLDVDLMSSAIPVGTCFFAFEVPETAIQGPDYLQDYNLDRLCFRYNKAGVYGQQTKADGATLVMAEVPCHPANIRTTATDENQKRAWSDLLETGYLKPGTTASEAMYWGHPVAYTMPKVGWQTPYEAAQKLFRAHSERLLGIEFGYRGRFSFMTFYETRLQQRLLA